MLSRLRLPRVGAALQPCPVPVTQAAGEGHAESELGEDPPLHHAVDFFEGVDEFRQHAQRLLACELHRLGDALEGLW
eukprot:805788-Prymnesium_polylepis.1